MSIFNVNSSAGNVRSDILLLHIDCLNQVADQ